LRALPARRRFVFHASVKPALDPTKAALTTLFPAVNVGDSVQIESTAAHRPSSS
jgi:hypothetical protein